MLNKKGYDIMTNLELMICEAENAGEIDLDTRDIMLDVFLMKVQHNTELGTKLMRKIINGMSSSRSLMT